MQKIILGVALLTVTAADAQVKPKPKQNDVTTPLHAMKVDYPTPYGAPSKENVKAVVDKVYNYLNAVTPAQMINQKTGAEVTDVNALDTNTVLKQGDFRLTSYEWGVTYSAFQRAF